MRWPGSVRVHETLIRLSHWIGLSEGDSAIAKRARQTVTCLNWGSCLATGSGTVVEITFSFDRLFGGRDGVRPSEPCKD